MDRAPKSTPFPRTSYVAPSGPTPPLVWTGIKKISEIGVLVRPGVCCSDLQDSIYVAGSCGAGFNGSTGTRNVFVLKYDKFGILQWTKVFDIGGSAGSTANMIPYRILCDSLGNVYVTGASSNNFNGEVKTSAANVADSYLLKLSGDGNVLWTRLTCSTSRSTPGGLALDSFNNIYVCGTFQGSLEGSPNTTNFKTFIKKYDSNGNQLLLKIESIATAGTATTLGCDIKIDNFDNIYLCGSLTGAGDWGIGTNVGFFRRYDSNFTTTNTMTLGQQSPVFGFEIDNLPGFNGSTTNVYLASNDGFLKYPSYATNPNTDLLVDNRTVVVNEFPTSIEPLNSSTVLRNRLCISRNNPLDIYIVCELRWYTYNENNTLYTGFQNFYEPGYSGYTMVSRGPDFNTNKDAILSKFTSGVNKSWTVGIGGNENANSSPDQTSFTAFFNSCCTDSLGNIFVCGRTNLELPGTTKINTFSANSEDGILFKYNSNGNLQ